MRSPGHRRPTRFRARNRPADDRRRPATSCPTRSRYGVMPSSTPNASVQPGWCPERPTAIHSGYDRSRGTRRQPAPRRGGAGPPRALAAVRRQRVGQPGSGHQEPADSGCLRRTITATEPAQRDLGELRGRTRRGNHPPPRGRSRCTCWSSMSDSTPSTSGSDSTCSTCTRTFDRPANQPVRPAATHRTATTHGHAASRASRAASRCGQLTFGRSTIRLSA